ncbi:hypothetical protein CG394_06055 [Gardnerella vaginalis]|uniref:Uncharacterized protein n=1 Tax=Gardnerella vaginalis (strain ATCC 14019 / 317) TaxID=525284 RepID=E3D7I7_GARV3|nr:hypothetical protein HMPREF0421_21197 [Gardnerella vaginalis ATCC 14019]RFT24212.1 hypothetical protein CG394_06055 [Gardnerella vaginalis]RFT31531.1 hypothetical protein CG403_04965 [Gardnerella vaginalis]TCH80480.1 hypothetical protein E0E48_04155 [Gardnerella vaginalis]TCH81947.1 hypothetical protein E0E46_03785 [Gardnerella vaginalis ATCC 14018 = JCM 11026]
MMKITQLFKQVRGLGDSWSNSIRAAADSKQHTGSRLQTNLNQKTKQKSQIGTTATTEYT